MGDLCNFNFGTEFTAPNGAPANVTLGSRNFLIQRNFVNSSVGGGCQISYGASGTKASGTVAVTGAFDNDEGDCVPYGHTPPRKQSLMTLPGYNGMETCRQLRLIWRTSLITILIPRLQPQCPGPILPAGNGDNWQILLTTKTAGASVNYGVSGSVNSFFGNSPSLAVTSNFILTGGSGSCC